MFRQTGSTLVRVALSLIAILVAGPALAHATLKSADPAPNATVAAPNMVRLLFSEVIAKKFSTFKVTDADGNPVPMTTMDSNDAKSLLAMSKKVLASGLYTVSWIAVSTGDGHKTMGTFTFTVQ